MKTGMARDFCSGDLRVWNTDCPKGDWRSKLLVILHVWDPEGDSPGVAMGTWVRYMTSDDVGMLPASIIHRWTDPVPGA
jgi:hypothetical protein